MDDRILTIVPQPASNELTGYEHVSLHPDIAIVESNRQFGNTDPRFDNDYARVLRNRVRLAKLAGARRLVCMVPQCDDGFIDLEASETTFDAADFNIWPPDIRPASYSYDPAAPPYVADLPTDGLITRERGVGLMFNPADCMPLVLYDAVRKVLALAHVSRTGTDKDIGPQMLARMAARYGTRAPDIIAYFGPGVTRQSYRLSYLNPSMQSDRWQRFIEAGPDGYAVDLLGYAAERLVRAGVDPSQMSHSAIDTGSDPDYFSLTQHRNTGAAQGRNGFVVAMRGDDSARRATFRALTLVREPHSQASREQTDR